jgi:hypothetical protein
MARPCIFNFHKVLSLSLVTKGKGIKSALDMVRLKPETFGTEALPLDHQVPMT